MSGSIAALSVVARSSTAPLQPSQKGLDFRCECHCSPAVRSRCRAWLALQSWAGQSPLALDRFVIPSRHSLCSPTPFWKLFRPGWMRPPRAEEERGGLSVLAFVLLQRLRGSECGCWKGHRLGHRPTAFPDELPDSESYGWPSRCRFHRNIRTRRKL